MCSPGTIEEKTPRRGPGRPSGFTKKQAECQTEKTNVPDHSIQEQACKFPDVHCMKMHKGFAKTKRRRPIGQQPGTKSGRRTACKPFTYLLLVNRSSTARCVQPYHLVYKIIYFFVLPSVNQDGCLHCLGEKDGRLNPGRTDPPPSRPALPRPPRPASHRSPRRCAPPRPVPRMVRPRFGLDK